MVEGGYAKVPIGLNFGDILGARLGGNAGVDTVDTFSTPNNTTELESPSERPKSATPPDPIVSLIRAEISCSDSSPFSNVRRFISTR
eukprot:CAMPEP_0113615832 /NCGR_PEP_ID=MMETSP0017_2-20120614/7914_1 /TAXON_ID=2856 /ORGANISM="Cylindrotheca closterium" /LENGTH=86 /DNA_ID=CAMNT_0000525101 /DNA_START=959 /DNA_END=1219 /DNA_ORIENTATION=- /assembly_acc=CAM_ASM_000147